MLDTTKIGDSIHAHRKRAALTQRKLGELARIGISNISSYENGKIPCLYNAIAIADALRVSLDDLIGRVVMDCPTLTPPNEWVSVENALPPNMDDVLVVVQNNGECWAVTGYYSNTSNVWYAMLNGQDTQMDVLWWMPFPEPPDRRPPEGET